MTLGELKKSLTRFTSDMDDTEILFTDVQNGESRFDNLAFVAYSEMKDENETVVLILGTMAAALDRLKNGTLKYADGRKPGTDGFDLSGQGTD